MVQQEKFYMSNQPQLFETEDQYGNDIIQGPKINKRKIRVPLALVHGI